jgi:nucleotidyltransferase substrate binding protein (TIGR01987 family)
MLNSMTEDIRWQQRYQNYRKAFLRLKEAIELDNPSELERNGLVRRFEFTIELGWKTMKDFLIEKGFSFKPSPMDTLRQAAAAGYIDYAQELIDGLNIRNALTHDYDGQTFETSEPRIRKRIYPALEKLIEFFQTELNKYEANDS